MISAYAKIIRYAWRHGMAYVAKATFPEHNGTFDFMCVKDSDRTEHWFRGFEMQGSDVTLNGVDIETL